MREKRQLYVFICADLFIFVFSHSTTFVLVQKYIPDMSHVHISKAIMKYVVLFVSSTEGLGLSQMLPIKNVALNTKGTYV